MRAPIDGGTIIHSPFTWCSVSNYIIYEKHELRVAGYCALHIAGGILNYQVHVRESFMQRQHDFGNSAIAPTGNPEAQDESNDLSGVAAGCAGGAPKCA